MNFAPDATPLRWIAQAPPRPLMVTLNRALRARMAGWPAYDVLYETGGPGPRLARKIFSDAHFQCPHPNRIFPRELGVDPLSAASACPGANTAPPT